MAFQGNSLEKESYPLTGSEQQVAMAKHTCMQLQKKTLCA